MVPFSYVEDITAWLANNHLPLIALEQSPSSIMLPEFSPPSEFALLLGEEVHGIAPELLARCDHTVEIPMFGQKESFNVSVAAGIALYELLF